MHALLEVPSRGLLCLLALALGVSSVPAAPPRVHSLRDSAFFFRAQDGTVLTLLMLEFTAPFPRGGSVPGAGAPVYEGVASVEEEERGGRDAAPGAARTVPLAMPVGPGKDRKSTFFGRVYLQPGRKYTLRYLVKDEKRDELFLKNALVEVPYLSGGFSVSSVVPAEVYGPARVDAGPFQVGSEEVVPKAGGLFKRSDLLRLYLQVYDAKLDPQTARRRVDVSFRFYRVVNGASKRHGKPFSVRAAAGPSMGLALPIGDWPTGSYRVVVELYDRVSTARTSSEGTFSVVDE